MKKNRLKESFEKLLEVKFNVEKAVTADNGDMTMLIKGYASIFDEIEYMNEVTLKGAFAKSIERRQNYPLYFEHKRRPGMPDPIGVTTSLQEDGKGLLIEGELTLLASDQNYICLKPIFEKIQKGLISGLSVSSTEVYETGIFENRAVKFVKSADITEISVTGTPVSFGSYLEVVEKSIKVLSLEVEENKKINKEEKTLALLQGFLKSKRS